MIPHAGHRQCIWPRPKNKDAEPCGRALVAASDGQVVCSMHLIAYREWAEKERMKKKGANYITNEIMLRITETFGSEIKLWRRNVGMGASWSQFQVLGTMIRQSRFAEARGYLEQMRPIAFGMPGEPDIDGIVKIRNAGVRLGIEVKVGRDKQREEQAVCQRVWHQMGAIYILTGSAEDAVEQIRKSAREIAIRTAQDVPTGAIEEWWP